MDKKTMIIDAIEGNGITNEETKEVLSIAAKRGYSANELYTESECVAEYGEWMHMPLMGYMSQELWEAADILNGIEKELAAA